MPDVPLPRQVTADTAAKIAVSCLARMACVYGDPARDNHNHGGGCLVDDEAYIAHWYLYLLTQVVAGDEDKALDAMLKVMGRVRRPR